MDMKYVGAAGVLLVTALSVAAFKDKIFPAQMPQSTITQAQAQPVSQTISLQQQFVRVVETTKRSYIDSRGNSMGVLPDRAAQICSLGFPLAHIVDWTGVLRAAGTTSNNMAYVRIEIAPGVHVATRSTYVTDIIDDSLIPVGSTIANNVAGLRLGSRVRFSGIFVPDNKDCIRESSITNDSAIRNPTFITRFMSITRE